MALQRQLISSLPHKYATTQTTVALFVAFFLQACYYHRPGRSPCWLCRSSQVLSPEERPDGSWTTRTGDINLASADGDTLLITACTNSQVKSPSHSQCTPAA